jgi:hypothetical protein
VSFFEDGTYGLQANDGRFLSASSELKVKADATCKFILTFEFKQRMFAFRTPGPKEKASESKHACVRAYVCVCVCVCVCVSVCLCVCV